MSDSAFFLCEKSTDSVQVENFVSQIVVRLANGFFTSQHREGQLIVVRALRLNHLPCAHQEQA